MARKPTRIEIRPDAYVLFTNRASGYDLYVLGELRGCFDTIHEATTYADRLLTRLIAQGVA